MTGYLSRKDIFLLSLMTFSLFVGAGNIIFPPIIGFQAGQNVWSSILGFLISGIGFPMITIIALARVRGNIRVLSAPIGHKIGLLLSFICYFVLGPLFAIPRTTTVSFVVGVEPFIGIENKELSLLIYSLIYFTIVVFISLYPNRLLDTLGCILAPIKIVFLIFLAAAAILWPAGQPFTKIENHSQQAFLNGFLSGYLTMDSFGAMVFSTVIVSAIRSCGVTSPRLLTRYTILSGLIAFSGIAIIYLIFIKLGAESAILLPEAQNGAEILNAYVHHTFGVVGSGFMMLLMTLACLVTAVGLTCACTSFFSKKTGIDYKKLVFLLGIFSMMVSNFGLTYLNDIAVLVLTTLHPPCIILILLSFTFRLCHYSTYSIIASMLVSSLFGLIDGIKLSAYYDIIPDWLRLFPLSSYGLSWVFPTLLVFICSASYERFRYTNRVGAF